MVHQLLYIFIKSIALKDQWMPCGYHMNLDDGLITVSGTDASTFNELLCVGQDLLADPQFDPNLPHLVDLRGMQVQRDVQSSAALRHFTVKSYRPQVQSSVAVVVDDHLTNDLLAAMLKKICQTVDISPGFPNPVIISSSKSVVSD